MTKKEIIAMLHDLGNIVAGGDGVIMCLLAINNYIVDIRERQFEHEYPEDKEKDQENEC